ncbi:MAG: homogentisate 1,2-dioxygenase [Myxococcales bacterium]|nr:homogentisate 1,2-dioxygenase [Myxococcales bacterium]
MLERMAVGELSRKHHLALRGEGGALRYEHCLTREGFDGAYSILYHLERPQALCFERSEARAAVAPSAGAPRIRRHFRCAKLTANAAGEPSPLLTNAVLKLGIWNPQADDAHYRIEARHDLLLFVHSGSGTLRSVFGDLDIAAHDYVCIPKGVLHRFIWNDAPMLLHLGCQKLAIPRTFRNDVGQLRMDAPYCHRDFRRPRFEGPRDEGLRDIAVEQDSARLFYRAPQSPLDVVGWDGSVYPWAFPIAAFQPRTGSVHLPPTAHGTFEADGALICSFVPRLLDFDPEAIPAPYPHSSVDIDEVLYYVSGDFASRTGIEQASLTLHARGVPHGPHPGRYEASIGQDKTEELAVMVDCRDALTVCAAADAIEDADYEASFRPA